MAGVGDGTAVPLPEYGGRVQQAPGSARPVRNYPLDRFKEFTEWSLTAVAEEPKS